MIQWLNFAPGAGRSAGWRGATRFGLVIALVGLALLLLPPVAALEESAGLDWLFQNRGYRDPPSQAVVVSVDKRSSDLLAVPTEPRLWPRSFHADLIARLVDAGAAVIAFDIYFDKPRDADSDQRLGDAIAAAGNVILFEYIDKDILPGAAPDGGDIVTERLVRPVEVIGKGALITATFPLPVVPVKVSRFWAFTTGGGDVATLPVAAYQAWMRDLQAEFNEMLRVAQPQLVDEIYERGVAGDTGWETRRVMSKLRGAFVNDSQLAESMLDMLATRPEAVRQKLAALISLYAGPNGYYLNFYGPPRTVRTVSYADVLAGDRAGLDLAGKVVFVGYSAEMQPDQKDSFFSVYSQTSGLNLSGVEIAATAFANIYEGSPVTPLGGWQRFLLVLLWGIFAGVVTCLATPVAGTLAAGALAVGYIYISAWQFATQALWLPLIVPLTQLTLAWVVMLGWKLLRTRARFGQFVPPQEVDRLAAGSGAAGAGDWAYRALLSADVASYTSSAERYTQSETGMRAEQRSEALWQLMNDYFAVINLTVEQHGGVVCDQEGDSSIAVWECANKEVAVRERALRSALAIQTAMDEFHRTRIREFNAMMHDQFGVSEELSLPTRIGVHAGRVRMGKIGGGHHYEFHVFGDPVNTVARIQQHNKKTATRILASAEVLDGVAKAVVSAIGPIRLRGKSRSLPLFELRGMN